MHQLEPFNKCACINYYYVINILCMYMLEHDMLTVYDNNNHYCNASLIMIIESLVHVCNSKCEHQCSAHGSGLISPSCDHLSA